MPGFFEKASPKVLASQEFSIPVTKDTESNFTHRSQTDPYHPLIVTEKIANFIRNSLSNIKQCVPGDFELELLEVVCNSYDAFAKQPHQEGEALKITVTLKQCSKQAVLLIADNAGGFPGLESSFKYTISDIAPENKGAGRFYGGDGEGLKDFHKLLKEHGISLSLSNKVTPDSQGAELRLAFDEHRPTCFST